LRKTEATYVLSDCPGCVLNLADGMYKHGHYKEVKVMHLAEYLAERLVEEEKMKVNLKEEKISNTDAEFVAMYTTRKKEMRLISSLRALSLQIYRILGDVRFVITLKKSLELLEINIYRSEKLPSYLECYGGCL
jgi:hypothetical protein